MYVLALFIFVFFAFKEQFIKADKLFYLYWFFCFLFLIFHDGLRWETGTDWIPYSTYFERCLDLDWDEFEIGYVMMSCIVRFFTDNYSCFLLLHALILYVLVFSSLKKYAISPYLSLFLYYCMMLPFLGMNRQFIAVGFCLFSIRYIIDRKLLLFLLSVGLAMLFHTSAIMFICSYALNKTWKRKYYIAILSIAILISLSGIVNRLPLELFLLISSDAAEKMEYYANDFLYGNTVVNPVFVILSLLKRLIWIVLILIYVYNSKKEDKYFSILFNIYIVALVFYILFNNTILQIVVSRGLIYFNIAEIFIIPYVLVVFVNNLSRKIAFLLIVLFGILNMNKGLNSYASEGETTDLFIPYKGIFINIDYVRKDH